VLTRVDRDETLAIRSAVRDFFEQQQAAVWSSCKDVCLASPMAEFVFRSDINDPAKRNRRVSLAPHLR
jgi:hypothetical protein